MSNFIFRIPGDCPDLTFDDLDAWLGRASARAIGTTVVVYRTDEAIEFELYGLVIAELYERPRRVVFPSADDAHLATSEWIGKIVRDNCIGTSVYRVRRRKADGPGPEVARGQAGLLIIDGDRSKTVFGQSYPVAKARIAAARKADAKRRVRWEADRERYAEESRAREALKTWTGPEGTFYASDDYSHDDGIYWTVVDATFRDNGTGIVGADYHPVGYIYDTRPGAGASPEPDPSGKTVFAAFAGADRSRERGSLGSFAILADAVAAVARSATADDLLAATEKSIAALTASVGELTGDGQNDWTKAFQPEGGNA